MRTASLGVILALAAAAHAGPPGFPEATHKAGRLKYVDGLPVLVVRGTPAEIGEQFGVLAVKNAPGLDALQKQFLVDVGLADRELILKIMARRLEPGIPEAHLRELKAAVQAADRSLGDALFANTIYDLSSGMGCSTIVVEAARSDTGHPLLARNFDWMPTAGISEHTLVVVYHPAGKHAFAAVTIAPITGCISGMNDAGLALTLNEIHLDKSADKSAFDWDGTPTMFAFRRVLEECTTVAEAAALLRTIKRTTAACMTVCDRKTGAVIEMTPKTVNVRTPAAGLTCCTNHFLTDGLAVGRDCWRLPKLEAMRAGSGEYGVDDLFARLGSVHQGKNTLQSMVFEPAGLVLHLKYGTGPATTRPTVRLDLKAMLASE